MKLPRQSANGLQAARERQYARYGEGVHNANVSNEPLTASSQLSADQQKMIRQWASQYKWSTRSQMKVLRLARTISDLEDCETITNEAVWEAVTMRRTHLTGQAKAMVT